MKYLRVKNWGNFQHYKKRSPPWIKLHREIVNDYAFQSLKDRAKAHLILIWVLAAGTDGLVPANEKFLANRIGASDPVDIAPLIAAGFVITEEGPDIDVRPSPAKGNGEFPTDDTPVIERIPCTGGQEYDVRQSFVAELERLYPGVDIPQTLREMRGWCIGNPTRIKTIRGARRFITSWLGREQNK